MQWTEPVVLLTVALAIAAAVTLALLLAPSAPSDDSPEAGFARDMSVHHAQAVEMAEIARDRTEDPEVRLLATDIALTQQNQIGQMLGWLDVWGLPATGADSSMSWMGHTMLGGMPGMASREAISALATMPPSQIDKQFLRLMIRHHRGALPMVEAAMERTRRPEVVTLARSIVESQTTEIDAMQDMLRQRGSAPAGGEVTMSEGKDGSHRKGSAASVSETARDMLSLAPLPLAVFAIAWLCIDDRRRRVARLPAPVASFDGWRAVAVGGLLASAAVHIGLAPAHFAEVTAFVVFFSASGVILAVVAAWILAWASRPAYVVGAAEVLVLVVLWGLFRVVPPPGAATPEEVDLVSLATKVVELAALAGCVVSWGRSGRRETPSRRAVEASVEGDAGA